MHFNHIPEWYDDALWGQPQSNEPVHLNLFAEESERISSGVLLIELYVQLAVLLWRMMWRRDAHRA